MPSTQRDFCAKTIFQALLYKKQGTRRLAEVDGTSSVLMQQQIMFIV